ncbi:MAG: peroxiredoxin family protein [Solirubrobacteraceae bacterium]
MRVEADMHRKQHRRRIGRAGAAAAGLALVIGAVALSSGGGRANGAGPIIGRVAPSFGLTDAVSGRQVTLASLRGHKTLLFFSEGTTCQACMQQIVDLQSSGGLRKAGIQLVSVTTDTPSELKATAQQYGITTPLLADPSTRMSTAYGMIGHGGMEMPNTDGHAFMLLGPDGRVLWHHAISSMYISPAQLMHDMNVEASS